MEDFTVYKSELEIIGAEPECTGGGFESGGARPQGHEGMFLSDVTEMEGEVST